MKNYFYYVYQSFFALNILLDEIKRGCGHGKKHFVR